MGCCSEWRSFKSRWQQNRDCPRTGAVPGLCGANRDSFMKLLGQPPLTLGINPEFTAKLLKLAPFDVVPYLTNRHIANEPYDDARVLLLPP